MSDHRCEVCGQRVRLNSSDEGTCSYDGIAEKELEQAQAQVAVLRDLVLESLIHIPPEKHEMFGQGLSIEPVDCRKKIEARVLRKAAEIVDQYSLAFNAAISLRKMAEEREK